MQIYREDIEKIDASFDAKSSAYKRIVIPCDFYNISYFRLEESTEMLFHTSMYKQKVAAVTIGDQYLLRIITLFSRENYQALKPSLQFLRARL